MPTGIGDVLEELAGCDVEAGLGGQASTGRGAKLAIGWVAATLATLDPYSVLFATAFS